MYNQSEESILISQHRTYFEIFFGNGRSGMVVLRLDGARVDTVMMQYFSDIHRDGHEIMVAGRQDVH